MHLPEIQERIEQIIDWLDVYNQPLAEAKANYEQKKDYQKTKLALCSLMVSGKTQGETERLALSHEDYQSFLDELADTRLKYLKIKCEHDANMAKLDALRSLNKNIQ